MTNETETPLRLGFRMPAEWEPHEATWLAWPHNRADWPGKFAPVPWVYCEVVRRLARVERVRILVPEAATEAKAREQLLKAHADLDAVEFFHCQTNRSWTRDYLPMFLKNAAGDLGAAKFCFNAWAKYRNWDRDNAAGEFVASQTGARLWRPDFVLEGGAIDVNGQGTVLTTEECLLSSIQARNPGASRDQTEEMLREYLGVREVLWLRRGIAGDDTHGHVDDVARFVKPHTVVVAVERDPNEANYEPLQENLALLRGMPLEVVELPMPRPVYFDGQRLPASYANFYIANALVLAPTFNDPADRVAIETLASVFPDREVVGIGAVDLVLGLGTLHCMTMQQPH